MSVLLEKGLFTVENERKKAVLSLHFAKGREKWGGLTTEEQNDLRIKWREMVSQGNIHTNDELMAKKKAGKTPDNR